MVLLLLDNWPLKGRSISGSLTRGFPTALEMSALTVGAPIHLVSSLTKKRDVEGSFQEKRRMPVKVERKGCTFLSRYPDCRVALLLVRVFVIPCKLDCVPPLADNL